MRIRSIRRKVGSDIVTVGSDFARILSVVPERGVFSYEFSFVVDQLKSVQQDLSTVQILIRQKPKIKKPSVFAAPQNEQDIKPITAIQGLITAQSQTKELKLKNLKAPFVKSSSVMRSKLSRSVTQRVKSAQSEAAAERLLPRRKAIVPRRISTLRAQNRSAPVMKLARHVSTTQGVSAPQQPVNANQGSIQAGSLNLILSKKMDPSAAVGATTLVASTQHQFAGTKPARKFTPSTPKRVNLTARQMSPFITLIGTPTNPESDANILADIEIPVIEEQAERYVTISHFVNIKDEEIRDVDEFIVEFKLLGKNNNVLGTITKVVKHRQLLRIFNTPREAPIVKVAPVQRPGRNVIELTQVDANATSVRMYRKIITRVTNVNDPSAMAYSYAGETIISRADQTMKIVDRINNSSTIIYRFVAVGPNGEIGSEFTNVVVPGTGLGVNRRRKSVVSVSIDVVTEANAARVRVTNIVRGPISIALQKRNRTTHERNFEFVGAPQPITLLESDEDIQFLDVDVKPDNIYEYRCMLYLECGSEELSTANFLYEHPNENEDGVEIVTTEPRIEKTSPFSKLAIANGGRGAGYDVKFSIQSELDETDLDQVKKVLERQGTAQLFRNELEEGRDALSKLIAHGVKRFNTSTGELEDFGVISDLEFSDVKAGKARAVKPLRAGITYRYIITTLLRSPETMFNDFVKVRTSLQRLTGTRANPSNLTTQQYQLKPSKFLHPLTLKRGTLSTPRSRKLVHARDEFMYGAIGNTRVVELTIPAEQLDIVRTRVQRADKVTNVVTWDIVGDPSQIDYFLITMSHLGTEQVVGQVHALTNTTTFEFIHELEDVDVGTAEYTITAMLNTFEKGPSADTDRFCI